MRSIHPRSVLALAPLSLALLAATPPALAQAPAPPAERPPDVFGEVIDVRVVNVEVVVTDRDGNRVTGLGPGDFRLTIDGEPVTIDYFSEVVGGVARRPADAAVAAAPGAGDGTVGTSYLVYVDDTFTIARDRDKVLRALADDLDFLGPGDRVAVVAFDGRKVDMLTSWSDDPAALRGALRAAELRPTRGLTRLAERRSHDMVLVGELANRGIALLTELGPEDRFFAQQVARQVETAVSGSVAALRGFAQPPGRKVMLLLAGGWPFSPATYAADVRSAVIDPAVPEGAELLRPLVDTANLLGYTIYPVDVPGLGGGGGTDVEIGSLGAVPVEPGADPTVGVSSTSPIGSLVRESNAEDSLSYLAGATGGRPLINARRLAVLQHVSEDTRSYYWLGFSPERQGDDRRHDIRVEVTRPGLRARSRDSFRDLSREAERQMAVESALLFGEPAAEGLLPVRVGEATPAGRRHVEVPIEIAIPVDFVTLLPTGELDHWTVRLEVRLAALDERQRQSPVPAVPIEITLAGRPDPGKYIPYQTRLKMRRAEQVLVVSVTDAASGQSLTARVPVKP
ncbi:MAG TPA: VWA domain-containing protein [Thermoanaerobaculia bacterium]